MECDYEEFFKAARAFYENAQSKIKMKLGYLPTGDGNENQASEKKRKQLVEKIEKKQEKKGKKKESKKQGKERK